MTREEKIIDELCRLLSDYERNQPREEAQKERYRWAVKEVTKALQEQKVGKWVHGREIWREHIGDAIVGIGYEDWRCSECNTLVKEDAQKILWKYCPWCGAKMEGAE